MQQKVTLQHKNKIKRMNGLEFVDSYAYLRGKRENTDISPGNDNQRKNMRAHTNTPTLTINTYTQIYMDLLNRIIQLKTRIKNSSLFGDA